MEKKKEIVRKHISTEVINGIETIKNEIIEVPENDWSKIFSFVDDIIVNDRDPESYYSKGIADDFNGDLRWIKFDWLIGFIEDRMNDLKDEEPDEDIDYEMSSYEEILPILTKYKNCVY